MKNLIKFLTISLPCLFIIMSTAPLGAQDDSEVVLDGDHFSLEGALDLFKSASSPENFEALLNQ